MNTIETNLDHITSLLGKLYGLPSGVLILFTCIIFGYVLRYFKSFPNDGIPIAVILWGGIFFPIVCDFDGKTPIRIWILRNVFIGLVIGFVAWLAHNKILSRIETWLETKQTTVIIPPTNPPVS